LVKDKVPIVMQAFMDFRVNAMSFTGPEIEAINNKTLKLKSPGEDREFQEKLKKIGLLDSN